ncbi:substrate-binding domain-containing protein [Thiohalobacter sp. IOR34]|uniref:substrate-binding domain-containing protein n=1 Tax=Thiohalobacter sp. IOR34 TaxID=3057176 RepID=UPI0025B1F5D1|nr:substrate-binding domain-containing protein [Thiohalobacter sp. IOR34]WJW75913.1 substrate-binding domain-containing protein [Thiohalobacter sp. IOR34]
MPLGYRQFKTLLAALLLLANPLHTFAAKAAASDSVITGAGAHFAWVIFDALKPDLERITGRRFDLHGLNSGLGLGCKAGIKLARQNSPEHQTFGFVCCPLSKEELAEKGLVLYPIALEPILILVNEDNPVTGLSSAQVRAIFRGEITNWKEVGGRDQAIAVVTRLHCKKRPGHWKTILPSDRDFREQRLNASSAAEMVKRVSAFPSAIGHIGSTWDFGPQSRVRPLRIDGFEPTAENLKTHDYPFFRQLSAVTDHSPSAAVLRAIHEVQHGKAMRVVARRYQLLPLAGDGQQHESPAPLARR